MFDRLVISNDQIAALYLYYSFPVFLFIKFDQDVAIPILCENDRGLRSYIEVMQLGSSVSIA